MLEFCTICERKHQVCSFASVPGHANPLIDILPAQILWSIPQAYRKTARVKAFECAAEGVAPRLLLMLFWAARIQLGQTDPILPQFRVYFISWTCSEMLLRIPL